MAFDQLTSYFAAKSVSNGKVGKGLDSLTGLPEVKGGYTPVQQKQEFDLVTGHSNSNVYQAMCSKNVSDTIYFNLSPKNGYHPAIGVTGFDVANDRLVLRDNVNQFTNSGVKKGSTYFKEISVLDKGNGWFGVHVQAQNGSYQDVNVRPNDIFDQGGKFLRKATALDIQKTITAF